MKRKTIFSTILFLSIIVANVGAVISPNPIISRSKPAYCSNGDASILVDNEFGGTSFFISNDSWIAINLGSGYSKVFISWNNPNYTWSDKIATTNSCKQGVSCPVDYSLQISSNSTNGSDGDWTTMLTVTGNTVTNRGHLIDFTGASWVRMYIDSGSGAINEVEVFDISGGGDDMWFFPGTSISANVFKASVPEQNFADLVAEAHPGYNPVMIRGGIPCISSWEMANDIDMYIQNAGNAKYWCIEMGTNDAWGGSNYNVETYRTSLQTIIDACKTHGVEPVIAKMIGTYEATAGWQVHPDYLTAIAELTTDNGLMEGPDLYTWFSTHPEDLASDGVHPSASGAASMQRLWAETMSSLYSGTTTIPVTELTISGCPEAEMLVAEQATLSVTVLPSNATNKAVYWSSGNTAVATVNSQGIITAVSGGTSVITATTNDGGYTASCELTVNGTTGECFWITYQAEDATWSNAIVDTNYTGYTGTGFVNTSNAIGEYIAFTFDISVEDSHDILLTYANGNSEDGAVSVSVNGSTILSNLSLPSTGVWTTWIDADLTANLVEGVNTITFTSLTSGGVPNIDKLEVCQVGVVNENQAPVATISVDAVSGSPGLTVNFDGTMSSDPEGDSLSYSWEFGDGSSASETITSHAYSAVGNYTATLTVSDGEYSDVASVSITISDELKPCDNPTTISMPFAQNGVENLCFVTSDDIAYVNSWNMSEVTINGMDYTNTWSGTMPDKIDGNYFISYIGLFGWSHFEAGALKSTNINNNNGVFVYPNPFYETATINIDNPQQVNRIVIYDNLGRIVMEFDKSEISKSIQIDKPLKPGIYMLCIYGENAQTILLNSMQ